MIWPAFWKNFSEDGEQKQKEEVAEQLRGICPGLKGKSAVQLGQYFIALP